jgi:hypothetical protein
MFRFIWTQIELNIQSADVQPSQSPGAKVAIVSKIQTVMVIIDTS